MIPILERKEINDRVVTMVDLNTPPPVEETPPVEIQEVFVALKDLSALTPEPIAKSMSRRKLS
ncbi:MAG: hypothetical protein R2942_18880 [Ignavibacteria bacterium]